MKRFLLLLFLFVSGFAVKAQLQSPLNPVQVEQLFNAKQFLIKCAVATTHYDYFMTPTQGYYDQNINIVADSSILYLNDTISFANLPYFSVGYPFPQYGIRGFFFKSKTHDLSVYTTKTPKRHTLGTIEYVAYGIGDQYRVSINIDRDGTTYIHIVSQRRGPLSYIGTLYPLNKEVLKK